MNDIVIVGAGGFGREVNWLIDRINKIEKTYNVLGFIDDNKKENTKVSNLRVLGNINCISEFQDICVVVAIGNSKARKKVVEEIKSLNKKVTFPNLIDPSAIFPEGLLKGKGNIVCAQAVATVDIEIGNFNLININSTIGHDVKISDFVTLYPNVNVSGNVIINECTEIGTGTQIIQGKTIGENSIIGAGSVVIRDIESNVTAVGVPCKKIKKGDKKNNV